MTLWPCPKCRTFSPMFFPCWNCGETVAVSDEDAPIILWVLAIIGFCLFILWPLWKLFKGG